MSLTHSLTRREWIRNAGLAGLGAMVNPLNLSDMIKDMQNKSMRTRPVPSSGEQLPVVGLGTWIQFDVGESENDRATLTKVLKLMVEHGGEVIDSSPMYGTSEEVIGDLTSQLDNPDTFFYATKVWTRGRQDGIDQMNDSMRKMNRKTMDLMQVHNLVDYETHLETLQEWKERGKIRYTGITHYTVGSHDRLETIIRNRDVDFVQFNYNIRVRNAEQSLLETAHENDVAVIINSPYGGGSLFSRVSGKSLPDWAGEYDIKSWGQFFLKYILSHPAVTCVIPGTSDPEHLVDNMMAGYGRLPDEAGRKMMVEYFESL